VTYQKPLSYKLGRAVDLVLIIGPYKVHATSDGQNCSDPGPCPTAELDD